MRAVGTLNILFGVTGLCYFAVIVAWRRASLPGMASGAWFIFLSLSFASTVIVSFAVYVGIRLLKKDDAGLKSVAITFGAEIAYFVIYVVVFWLVLPLHGAGRSVFVASTLGMGPLDPQIATGYPLFGLIVTLLLRRQADTGECN